GGTFDPPHLGHLLAASDAYEGLALDRLYFVPAAQQPLKAGLVMAAAHHRAAMVERLVAGDPRFAVDAIEIERGGLSYTVDTLRALRSRWTGDVALFLLLGRDVVASLPKWREPEEVAALAQIVVLTRVGDSAELPAGLRTLATRRVDVSSTEVRARVREGKSIRGFVPDAVADYIAAADLYR
ncbi:MAG: nicotinate (nicotinamide) nucleotide adenylyltransferase, partial [Gemmatimonadetes bacterium]|nr:nicotinate (nicotinamide) nucleotide adenylyltransferase [Gemmatimonadota bacterium]